MWPGHLDRVGENHIDAFVRPAQIAQDLGHDDPGKGVSGPSSSVARTWVSASCDRRAKCSTKAREMWSGIETASTASAACISRDRLVEATERRQDVESERLARPGVVGAPFQDRAQLALGAGPVPVVDRMDGGQRGPRLRQLRVEVERAPAELLAALGDVTRMRRAEETELDVHVRQADVGRGERGIDARSPARRAVSPRESRAPSADSSGIDPSGRGCRPRCSRSAGARAAW